MDAETLELLIGPGLVVALLVLGYVAGSIAERRHYTSIRQRERELLGLPAITFEDLPAGWSPGASGLVTGSVVVSLDYFKRFLAGLRKIVGGRLRSYESLLDRARREAVLRMKEEARRRGFQAVVNVRLETSSIASSRRQGKGVAGVEVLAFGTGLAVAELARSAPAG
jgi:uncharacterized protein YbjQ (UPF0145 family)